MIDGFAYKSGKKPVPRRDPERDDRDRKASDVVERQMTPEERERMEKIGPYRDRDGQKRRPSPYPGRW
ncbi:hypothetical protein WJ0W_006637 [Paenibacillus melissococcoides]|uniref:Uncharacterized protein n=1 Tax=Paenibacillus melissococcoides TaxID=2912268 RepID=A0ABM9GDD6_9BACL|nr:MULTISPECIES: hypothetical protein [Paenibacillus]MEB9894040.1 hypothetical protein [Bacillus cereus]CAH8245686.1 hypothetical protein WJ0W_002921 [Paenibacillus melissococcoides]CAH8246316.1 hypothetical protein WJ0W_003551 [Paenibacillus melissococcoides]CAH8248420.1 hypothetical protein WJ0W_005683 [Paenibacillus melissococcoides]CAH8249452.1 hypothetical protein WJ0W_006637 [Paenibacillus melissococcoides]